MKILGSISSGYKRIATGIAIVTFLALMYVALIPGGTLAAVYTTNGVGIGGAFVKLSDYPQYNNTTSDGTDGRALGEYAIQEVPYGSYFMLTTHPSYAPTLSAINLSSPTAAKDITLQVCRTNFTDVTCGHWAYVYVFTLFDAGATSGYPDNTYRPNNQITRAEIATMIYRARNLAPYTGGLTDFSDVPPSHWAYNFIMAAKRDGIIGGYPDGTFGPSNVVTRAEISVMVKNARSWSYSGSGAVDFSDVPPTHWAYPFVMAVKEKKVVGGYPDGTFKPSNQLTRAEASVMVSKMMIWV